ncbi:TetR/AcrR family transcriptional regulator [Streptomyces sp. NPDC085946]|uniref:TetR/AcrR family transcriptional regulator n=1 Tax=Streptomyces sp. NPDC085946 TaxID=3365744 RepID=UPI0037D40C02
MSSTTPSSPVSLTERRKAETRMQIARAAAGLFVRHGLRATRAEDIAQAAGVAPRTFYRYFATKEEAVAPLYATGAQRWVEAVRTAPAGVPVPRALDDAVRHTLTPGLGVSAASWEWVRVLVRLAMENPSLRMVWAEVCQAAERTLAQVLAERSRGGGAAAYDGDARTFQHAEDTEDTGAAGLAGDGGTSRAAGGAGLAGAAGSPRAVGVTGAAGADDNVAAPAELLSFAAAVASAAVRVAVEGWAAGDAPAEGPEGPAERAVRNLAALRGFPWEAVDPRVRQAG